jgi:tRNA G10  N-methylase Trm11
VRCDAKRLPYPSGSLDAVVLDPPYMYVGGFRTLNERMKQYKNKERAVRDGIHGVVAVDAMYSEMMGDAYRVLRRHGVLIVKCMDQIMSGKRVLQHVTVVRIGEDLGMECDDIFVLVRKSRPMMRHKLQVHARVNHSYFVVFTKS